MIASMTGYGSAHFDDERISIHVQVKSVNGRFLETRYRVPREYSFLEIEIKKLMANQISRGTIDISINRVYSGKGSDINVTANLPLAQSWLKAAQGLAKELGLSTEISTEAM